MVAETLLVAAAYPVPKDAQETVRDLRRAGLDDSQISVIYTDPGHLIKAGVIDGAVWGGVLGGLVGLLFPPVGLLVAAGPLLGVLTSGVTVAALGAVTVAAFEGVVLGLISLGMPREIATEFGEKLKKGDALVIAHVSDPAMAEQVETIMRSHRPSQATAPTASTTAASGATRTA